MWTSVERVEPLAQYFFLVCISSFCIKLFAVVSKLLTFLAFIEASESGGLGTAKCCLRVSI